MWVLLKNFVIWERPLLEKRRFVGGFEYSSSDGGDTPSR
jgi:hypothetical protein